jgi:2-polyprenyl-3-methyl-5-hydroxy-6-metoxy-1,4-benzoquinol methylase
MSKYLQTSDTAIVFKGKVAKLVRKFVTVGSRILDISAAGGGLGRQLQDYKVLSADFQNYTNGLPFVEIDANKEWPTKEIFDCVVSIATIEHLENPSLFLREIFDHLKPKGVAIISFPDVTDFRHRLNYFLKAELPRYHSNKEHISIIHPDVFERVFPFEILAKGVSSCSMWYVGRKA